MDGFRWAPLSLIGHRSKELMRRGEHGEGEEVDVAENLADLKQVDSQRGLPVKDPGFVIHLKAVTSGQTFAIISDPASDNNVGSCS